MGCAPSVADNQSQLGGDVASSGAVAHIHKDTDDCMQGSADHTMSGDENSRELLVINGKVSCSYRLLHYTPCQLVGLPQSCRIRASLVVGKLPGSHSFFMLLLIELLQRKSRICMDASQIDDAFSIYTPS